MIGSVKIFGICFFGCLLGILPLGAPNDAQAGARTFHILYRFRAGGDGAFPTGALISDLEGNLYGTTSSGGGTGCGGAGCGTVFKLVLIQASNGSRYVGAETVLHAFQGGSDGAKPAAGLVMDQAGNLYGTTVYGGGSSNCNQGCGTVFKLSQSGGIWNETVLHNFLGGSDGAFPYGQLTCHQDAQQICNQGGTLYGTTLKGGKQNCPDTDGCGTMFQLTSDSTYARLYSFCRKGISQSSCPDGAFPMAGLVVDQAGILYGTTEAGGRPPEDRKNGTYCNPATSPDGCGTVFKFNPASGTEFVLHSFCSASKCGDGASPQSALVMDGGKLYGTTNLGGGDDGCFEGCGTIFEVFANGDHHVLYSFGSAGSPKAGLTIDPTTPPTLYGTAAVLRPSIIPSSRGAGGNHEPNKNCPTKGCGSSGYAFETMLGGAEKLPHNPLVPLHTFTGGQTPIAPLLLSSDGNTLFGSTEMGGFPCGGSATCGTVFEIVPIITVPSAK